jgi:hypothetical protein
LLLPPATKCVVYYLLSQQVVLELKACRVSTLEVNGLVAAVDSAMQRQHAALVGCSCGRMRTIAEAKAAFRACPSVCGGWSCCCLPRLGLCAGAGGDAPTAACVWLLLRWTVSSSWRQLSSAKRTNLLSASDRSSQSLCQTHACTAGQGRPCCPAHAGVARPAAGVCDVRSCQLPAPFHSCTLSNSSCSAGVGHAHASDCPGQRNAAAAAVLNPGRNSAWAGSKLSSLQRVFHRLLIITAHRSRRCCGHNRR